MVIEPDVPVMVTLVVPMAALAATVKVNVLVVPEGFGLKFAVTPLGSVEVVKVTVPLKPPVGVTATVLVPWLLCCTLSEFGFAVRVKFGVELQPGKMKLPMAVLQLKPPFWPVVWMYDSVNQNVQSSEGSTTMFVKSSHRRLPVCDACPSASTDS